MRLVESVQHKIAVAGRITDAQTGNPVAGAQVQMTDMPAAFAEYVALKALQFGAAWSSMLNRPDCTQTAVDGAFYFLDLPAGVYTFTVSLSSLGSRYGVVAATRVVPSNDVADLYVTADVALPPTTITGVVTDQSAAAVSMAKVQLVGSGEFTFADGDGRYALTGVEAGNRTIKISAKGFQTSFLPVTLADAGAVQTLDVVLSQ